MERADARQIAVYSRKSRFTGKGESIENQIELCKQYVRLHFPQYDLAELLIYEDEGFSGGNLQRPQFQRLLRDAQAGRLRAIICYRLDRVSRSIGDFARLIEELEGLDVAFISIKEQFDTDSPLGRAMMYISSVFSQLERETIAERIRDNMLELAKTGRWLGGVCPTGYCSQSVATLNLDGKQKRVHQLQLVPEQAELVRRIYHCFLTQGSLGKLESNLLEERALSKNGKPFSRYTLRNILTNPVYLIADAAAYDYWSQSGVELCAAAAEFDGRHGVMAYNRTLQKRGKAPQTRPLTEWIVAVGRHQGLITGQDWLRVQELLAQNSNPSYRRPHSQQALLAGLLQCAACGSYMRPKQRQGAGQELRYSYLCKLKEKSHSQQCQAANVPGRQLDTAVWQVLLRINPDRATIVHQLEQGQARLQREQAQSPLGRWEQKRQHQRRERDNLLAALEQAGQGAARAAIIERLEALEAQQQSPIQQQAQARQADDQELDAAAEADLAARLCQPVQLWLSLSLEQRRAALRRFVACIYWDGRSARLSWRQQHAE